MWTWSHFITMVLLVGPLSGTPASTLLVGPLPGTPPSTLLVGPLSGTPTSTLLAGPVPGTPSSTLLVGSLPGTPASTLIVGPLPGTPAAGSSGQTSSPGSPTMNPNLEFHCNPDDSINVTLTSAEQSYYSVELTCNRSTTLIKTVTSNETFITTCSKGENVTVTVLMSSSSTPIPSVTPITIIRNEKETFAFQCTEITSSGIVLLTDTSLNDKIPFSYMGTQKPEIQLQMYVTAKDSDHNKKLRSITIAETYKLHIDGPENYVVIPLKCYAADVSSGATGDRNVTLLENGCSCDIDIFKTKFQKTSQDHPGKVDVDFNGFRFVGSGNVYLECEVHVCPPNGCENSPPPQTLTDCPDQPKTCSVNRRKRSSVIQQKSIAIAKTAFVVHDSRIIASSAVGKEPVSTIIILCGLCFWTFAQRFQ